jgi:hypothetical protein
LAKENFAMSERSTTEHRKRFQDAQVCGGPRRFKVSEKGLTEKPLAYPSGATTRRRLLPPIRAYARGR